MSRYLHFARVPDAAVVRFVHDVLTIARIGSATIAIADNLSFTLNPGDDTPVAWRKTIGPGSYLITSASLDLPDLGMTFHFYRGQSFVSGSGWRTGDHPFVDGLQMDGPREGTAAAIPILAEVQKLMGAAPPLPLADPTASSFEQSTAILNRVSEAAANLMEHTSERQKVIDDARSELERSAASMLKKRQEEIDADAENARLALKNKEDALDARIAKLDDRENTHVRRELQKNMASISKATLTKGLLARSATSYGQTVGIAAAFAALLLCIATYLSGKLPASSEGRDILIFAEIRIVLLGILAAALIGFALRLSSSRYRQIARWEHDLNRFLLDTERAGFLIEGDLEARRVNKKGLPEVMLDRFSRGLFAAGAEGNDESGDPMGSTLSALLGRAASVKVGTDGVEVSVDKAGIKKARKDVEVDED